MSSYLYILQSISTNKYYVGVSDNPQRRLSYHNSIEKGFTARYRPWKIRFIKDYPNKTEALKIEQKIKKWKSRAMIERVISGQIEI